MTYAKDDLRSALTTGAPPRPAGAVAAPEFLDFSKAGQVDLREILRVGVPLRHIPAGAREIRRRVEVCIEREEPPVQRPHLGRDGRRGQRGGGERESGDEDAGADQRGTEGHTDRRR